MFGEADFVRSGAVLMLMLLCGKTQKVIPSWYATYQSDGVSYYYSANGSSPTGHCPTVIMTTISGYNVTTCTAPSSSVLFDGVIPTINCLDGNIWACQLLTLYIGQSSKALVYIGFNRTKVVGVEVVIFNCPDMGIAVEKINLTASSSPTSFNNALISSSTPISTSCDPLVTVNLLCSNQEFCNTTASLALEIYTTNVSNLIYIAEVRICGANNCPAIQTTTTATVCAKPMPSPSVTIISPYPSVTTLTTQQSTTSTSDKTDLENNILPIILPVVLLLFFLVCVVGVVLLLWRCYCAKHHKHNTTALGEGTHASPHPHSHPPPITLCEETGQALYSVVQDEAGEDSHYSHLQHGTDKVRGQDKIHEADTAVDQLYAQVDKKRSKKKDAKVINSSTSDANTPVDQLYAHVDKKKSATDHPSEIESAVDQLYAQVDKKKSKKKDTTLTTHYPSETEAAVDQLYAQVDKKKSKKKSKDMDKNFPEKTEAVYSVVNKPRPPPKSDLLTEDENEPPPLPPQSNLLMKY